jgi:outer membrane protein
MTVRTLTVALLAVPVLLLAAGPLAAPPAAAEERVAHANMELILSLMPEMKSVMSRLDSFEKELTQQLDVKRAYAQQKLSEAQKAAAGGATEDDLDRFRRNLQELDQEIQMLAADSGERMNAKREELLEPVVARLQETIAAIAEREGYTYVLNSVDGVGTSIVLYGAEEHNLTKTILKELGVEVPEEDATETAPAPAGK